MKIEDYYKEICDINNDINSNMKKINTLIMKKNNNLIFEINKEK